MSEQEINEMNSKFEAYIEEYKKQDIATKREKLINSIKDLIASIDAIGQEEGIELHYLKSREVLDLNGENTSEDDFLEAMLVYIETAKNLVGEYLLNKQ